MIKLIQSTFYKEQSTRKKLINFISRAGKLSFGRQCERFERNFAEWQGRKQAVMLNSGSSANLAVIQALLNLGKVRPGDLVGFSSLTWSTNVMPLIQLGLQAIPVDVELNTLNVSSRMLLKTLKRYPIRMLFLTNLLGFCDDIDTISNICREKKILLIEDNCEALGTVYKGKKLGNWGYASTFSFYVGHHMSTIEGGAAATDDEDFATMLQIVRAHGWDRNLTFTKQIKIRNQYKVNSTFYSRYTFYDSGYNLRSTEINGFLGNVQLSYLDEIIGKRRNNFFRMAIPIYNQTSYYYPIQFNHLDLISNFAVPVICRTQEIRDKLVKRCEGVLEIRPVVGGDMTKQPFYYKYMKKYAEEFKDSNANLIHRQGLYFGNNPELTPPQMNRIIRIFSF